MTDFLMVVNLADMGIGLELIREDTSAEAYAFNDMLFKCNHLHIINHMGFDIPLALNEA